MNQHTKTNRILAMMIFLISLIIYGKTVAPTTSFWDCGEFIACSYILGIPHPPGAPLYLLVGRVFSMIPFAEDIGLRVNIISGIVSALSVMFTYLIIVLLIKLWRGLPKTFEDKIMIYGGGIIGSLALAFSDSIWFNAVEAEVYSISLFFTAIIVWLILVWNEKADDAQSDRYILMIAYCVGLAIGVHLLNILALPALFLIAYFRLRKFSLSSFAMFTLLGIFIIIAIYPGVVKWIPNLSLKLSSWFLLFVPLILMFATYFVARRKNRYITIILMSFLLILMGTSTYAMIYIRSNHEPVIDENDPGNLENLVSYLNREQYGDWSIVERRAPLWEYQIKKMYLRYLGWQFIGKGTTIGSDGFIVENMSLNGLFGLPFLIGIFGLIHHFFKDRKRALAILLLFLMTGLAIVIYLNQPDPQPRERDYVFVGSFFAFALWIGVGIAGILETLTDFLHKSSTLLRRSAIAFISLVFLITIPVNMLAVNYHSHDRTGNFVAFDYSYNILQSCEPDAIVFTNGDNDTFPLWFLQYVYKIRPDVRVVNLSLLNTNWYVRQLKYQEPKVPISLTDAEIDNLSYRLWPEKKTISIEVPQNVFQSDIQDLSERRNLILPKDKPSITFELGPTFYGKAIRAQDWMILNIVFTNKFSKPIYFAVTVSPDNMLNLDDYLRMDGLCYKLVTYPGEEISASRLKKNLFEKFQYRNLNNPEVYYDDDILGLLINYRSAYLKLASFFEKEKMYPDMIQALDKLNEIMPENVLPVIDRRTSISIGILYHIGGQSEQLTRRLDNYLNMPGISIEEKLEYAQIFYQFVNDVDKAEQIAMNIITDHPNYTRGYYFLFNIYAKSNQSEKGAKLSRQLLSINPNDMQAKMRLSQFEQMTSVTRDSN